jgi:hypothetical protein
MTATPADNYAALARLYRPDTPAPVTGRYTSGRCTSLGTAGLLEITGAIVFSGEWFVAANNEILLDLFVQTPFPPISAYLAAAVGSPDFKLISEAAIPLPVRSAFLLGGCPNYAHWLLDYLPRLRLWRNQAPILVSDPAVAFQLESLRHLGIDESQLIRLRYPAAYLAPHLLFPSICSSSINLRHPFQPWILTWLRSSFAGLMSLRPAKRRILISRAGYADLHKRRILNEDEIVAAALALDFEVVAPETLSFAEQVELFSEAAVIAGAHGAGLTNMVFAGPRARVIELIAPRFAQAPLSGVFRHMASLMGQDLVRITGTTDEEVPIPYDHPPNETFRIDVKAFERAASGS